MLWGFGIILLYVHGDVCHPVVYLNGTVVAENDVHQVMIGTAIQRVWIVSWNVVMLVQYSQYNITSIDEEVVLIYERPPFNKGHRSLHQKEEEFT